jgi:hypothetical protein
MVRYAMLGLALLCFSPATANAGQCEDTFQRSGNIISGIRFLATISVPDLTPASAIGQLKGIVTQRNYQVMTDEAEDGSMLFEQAATEKARGFPIIATATSGNGVGTVRLDAKLKSPMSAPTDGARAELCAILNQLKGGKAGLLAAQRGRSSTNGGAPLRISALGLSMRLSDEATQNAAAIPLRYKGRWFIVDGSVSYVTKDGQFYRVSYDILDPSQQLLRMPGQANFKTNISCLMAKGQSAYALTLKPRKSIKLIGMFYDYDYSRDIMWLSECRPAD